jgi:hypothetical protein
LLPEPKVTEHVVVAQAAGQVLFLVLIATANTNATNVTTNTSV